MVTGHIMCRDYVLKHIIEGNIERKGRRGRRRKELLDFNDNRNTEILTFWRRNYYFFNFSTPCI